MALALAPGGADAPTAVFLLGEAGEGVAAALGEVGTGVTGRPAPPSLPPQALLLPPQPVGPRFAQSPFSWDRTTLGDRRSGPAGLWIHSQAAWAVCPGSSGPRASGWVAGGAGAWGAAAGAARGLGPRRSAPRCGELGPRHREDGARARSPRGAGPALGGGGARWLQGCPAPPVAGAVAHSVPATLVSAHFGHPGSARGPVPSAEICPGPRGTRKAACWAGGPSPGPGGSAITWTA